MSPTNAKFYYNYNDGDDGDDNGDDDAELLAFNFSLDFFNLIPQLDSRSSWMEKFQ